MRYDDIIIAISPIFFKHGFVIAESSINYTKFESSSVTFTFAFDQRENSFFTYLGRKNGYQSPLSDNVTRDVFQEDISSYKERSVEENLIHFFTGKGLPILKGDENILNNLELYSKKRNKEYHEQLMHQQKISLADNAWKNRDYIDFIKHIDSIDKNLLPGSYLKKYQIALSKTKKD